MNYLLNYRIKKNFIWGVRMLHLKFIILFTIAHTVSYTAAGAIALKFSKDIYESKNRLCNFLNDMEVEEERKHVEKYFLLAQIARGFLMAVVLIPIVSALKNFMFIMQFIFFASLMFVYTHISSAAPFMDNIEGQVYFKKEYLLRKAFFKFQLEMVMYSVLFGFIMTLFMNLI